MKRISLLLIIGFMMGGSLGLQAADNACTVCQEPIDRQIGVPAITRLSCGPEVGGHAFHTNCIARVPKAGRIPHKVFKCPNDRSPLSDQDKQMIKDNYLANNPNFVSPQDIIDLQNSITALGGLAFMIGFFYGLYHLYHDDPYAEQKPAGSEFEEIRRKAWVIYGIAARVVGFFPASIIWPLAYLQHSEIDMSAERDHMIGKLEKKDAIAAQDAMAKKHWNFLRKSSQMAGHFIISAVTFAAFTVMVKKLIKLPEDTPAIFLN